MKNRNFEDWVKNLRLLTNEYHHYTDFSKAYEDFQKFNFKVAISLFESLIRSKNIEKDFDKLIKEYPICIKAIPALLTFHKSKIDPTDTFTYGFFENNLSVVQYKRFMRQTSLFEMLQNRDIGSLKDYLQGIIEVLYSENEHIKYNYQIKSIVRDFLKLSGVQYYERIRSLDIEESWGYDLSALSNRCWDFVVKTNEEVFVIETNFYTDGGSKLNEVARSYKKIAEDAAQIENFNFVWITDGEGWKKAKNNLKETFMILPTLYNIKDIEEGIFYKLFKIEKN